MCFDRAVYPDGKVCISILHTPGTDPHNEFEKAEERWRPILGVEQARGPLNDGSLSVCRHTYRTNNLADLGFCHFHAR
jgi:hypothetical protein